MNPLLISLSRLSLRNPLILASGIMGETGASLVRIAQAGAGALVTKSIGLEPREGHTNPTIVELPFGYINSMGLPNPGIEAFGEEMGRARDCGVPIIGSVFASDAPGFVRLASRMEDYGASAVELNLSCPHAPGYGMELGVDPKGVGRIVREVASVLSVPLFAKLTPNTHEIVAVGRAVEEGGGSGVVAINTLRAMSISVEMGAPQLANRIGGLSGPCIRPVGVRCVYELYEAVDIPVIGVGGIESWQDAIEYMMAGASAFQVGSVIGRRGIGAIPMILNGISRFMEDRGIERVDQLVGAAHG